MKALICARSFKTSDYVGMVEALAPEIATSRPGKLEAARLPQLRIVAKIGGERRARLAGVRGHRSRRSGVTAASCRGAPHCREADQHPVHERHHWSAEGATLSHRNVVNNAYFVGASMGLKAGDRLCIPVPLYHCFGMVLVESGMRRPRRDDGLPFCRFRSAGGAQDGTGGALHGVAWSADHVHCRAAASGVRFLRCVDAARRDHGGRTLPDRNHASGRSIAWGCAKSPLPTA